MRSFLSVTLFLFLLISISFMPKRDIPCAKASPSVYQGDLVLADNNVTVIEGRIDINGSIIVEENATLHLKNAFLNFTQNNVRQHNVTLRHPSNGNPRLVAYNSTIAAHFRFDVILEDNSTATIDNCACADVTTYWHIIARDHSILSIWNSSLLYLFAYGSSVVKVYNSTIGGDWHNYDYAQVQVYNSEISSLLIGPESVNCTISRLEQGLISNWSFVTNCSVNILPEGSTPNLTLTNTKVNYLRFAFYGNSDAAILNSTIGQVCAIGGSSVIHLESTTCSYVYASSSSMILVTNCTLSQVEAHTNATIYVSNSTIDMHVWSTVFLYARNLANCSIVNLEPGIANYWNFEHNCSVVVTPSGSAPNFTLINTRVGAWSFGFEGSSNVTISNSDLLGLQLNEQVHTTIFNSLLRDCIYCCYNSKTYLYNSTLKWLYCYDNSRIWAMNSTTNKPPEIYDQSKVFVSWDLNVHVTDSIGENIASANVTATYPNATTADSKLTDANGWSRMMLMEKTMNATGAYPIGNYTVKASYWSYFNQTTVNMTGNREIILTLDGFVLPSTIFIRPNGSLDPSAAPIEHAGNLYTLTGNIYLSITVQRSGIVIDGAGYTLQGCGSGQGFDLFGIDNVTIQNTNVLNFDCGIDLRFSNNISVFGNSIMANNDCGIYVYGSSNNTISENNITANYAGIILSHSSNNCVSENKVTKNYAAIYLYESSSVSYLNSIFTNKLTNNYIGVLHWNSSNSDIFANTVANNTLGIGLYFSLNNSVSGNTLTTNNQTAIVIGPNSSHNSIYRNNLTKNQDGISTYDSSNNNIYKNNIWSQRQCGIALQCSSNNSIYENSLAENRDGITLGNSSSNIIHHNNFINNTRQVYDYSWSSPSSYYVPSINIWDDGYPSGGNYWSNYTGVDLYSGPYQNETGSDGIGDIPYTIDENNTDHYPLMKPCGGPYDIGLTSVTTSKSVVGQGYCLNVTIKTLNYGISTETFNVTAYANTTIIATFTDITLTSRNSTILTFAWNTTGFAKGNYIISAYAWPVSGETDIADNSLIADEEVCITIPGDLDADLDVDLYDAVKLLVCYGAKMGSPRYDPNCDIDGDGSIDLYDAVRLLTHYGEKYP